MNQPHTTSLESFLQELAASGQWRSFYSNPGAFADQTYGDVSGHYLAESLSNIQSPVAASADTAPGIQVVVEDVRLVLILDDAAVKSLINGTNIAAGIASAFSAATATIAALLASNAITIPASLVSTFITALAGIFSAFTATFAALLGELNKGNGVYLTITIPQLVIGSGLLLASLLFPLTAWITLPMAVAAMLIIPTTRP